MGVIFIVCKVFGNMSVHYVAVLILVFCLQQKFLFYVFILLIFYYYINLASIWFIISF